MATTTANSSNTAADKVVIFHQALWRLAGGIVEDKIAHRNDRRARRTAPEVKNQIRHFAWEERIAGLRDTASDVRSLMRHHATEERAARLRACREDDDAFRDRDGHDSDRLANEAIWNAGR